MKDGDWARFQSQYPELAKKICDLGNRLYGMGVEQATKSAELTELEQVVSTAPAEALARLGFSGVPTRVRLLGAVVDWGSTLLLKYVRTGKTGTC